MTLDTTAAKAAIDALALDSDAQQQAAVAAAVTPLNARIAELEAELHPQQATAWGVNIPRGKLPALDALFGGIQSVRFYHTAAGSHPIVRWPTAAELGGDLGSRVLVYSAKPPVQDVAAGKYDAEYEAFCAAAPTDRDTYLCVRHEPENDSGYTQADLRAAWARVSGIVKASGNPRIKVTPILMQYTLDPASKRTYTDWLPADYDAIGWDFYPTSTAAIGTMIGRMRAAAKAQGKPWIVGEVGVYGHPELAGPIAQALAAEKLPVITYFLGGNNALNAAQAAAWKAAQSG